MPEITFFLGDNFLPKMLFLYKKNKNKPAPTIRCFVKNPIYVVISGPLLYGYVGKIIGFLFNWGKWGQMM